MKLNTPCETLLCVQLDLTRKAVSSLETRNYISELKPFPGKEETLDRLKEDYSKIQRAINQLWIHQS